MSDGKESSDRELRIEAVVDDCIDRFKRSGSFDISGFIVEHADLAPELEERLDLAMAVARVFDRGSSSDPGNFFLRDAQLRIQCPHCGNRIRIVEDDHEVNCQSCGSSLLPDDDDPEATRSLDAGHQIGRFEILNEVGSGAFGIVHRARDPDLNRIVALKVPRPGTLRTRRERQRFLREARSAAKLRHPHIVKVHEIGIEGEAIFLISDFIEGITLDDLCQSQKVPYQRSASIVALIADALHYAHQQGVIHRDVKPSNVLLDSEGRPFLSDFGLARDLEPEFTMTRDGEIIGTPAYMSPEQAAAEHSMINATSDVYSAGVMLFRLLSGQLPFRGSHRMLLHQVMNVEPPLPMSFDDEIPDDLATIAMKAMEKEQRNRYQSAGELAADLRRYLSGDPIRAKRPSWFKVLWLKLKKYPLASSLSAAITLLVITLAVGSTFWAISESQLRDQVQSQSLEAKRQQIFSLSQQAIEAGRQTDVLSALPYLAGMTSVEQSIDGAVSERTQLRINMVLNAAPKLSGMRKLERRIDGLVPLGDQGLIHHGDTITLVKLPSLKRKRIFVNQHRSFDLVVNPLGSRLIGGPWSSGAAIPSTNLWDIETGRTVATLAHKAAEDTEKKPQITDAAFSPDGKLVATGCTFHEVIIWDAATGRKLKTLKHDEFLIRFVGFSRDSNKLITVTRGMDLIDSTIFIWDLESDKIIRSASVDGSSNAFELFQDSVLIGSDRGELNRWDYLAESSKPELLANYLDAKLLSIHRCPGFNWYGFEDNRYAIQLDGQKGKAVQGSAHKRSRAHSNDGTLTAVADGEHVEVSWLQTGTPLTSIPHGELVTSIDFFKDRWLVVGGAGGMVKLWDLASLFRSVTMYNSPASDPIRLSTLNSKSNRVCSVAGRGLLRLFDLEGDLLATHESDGRINDLEFSNDGSLLIVSTQDGTVVIFDADDLSVVHQESFGESEVDIKLSPTSDSSTPTKLAIASNSEVVIWDLQARKVLSRLPTLSKPRELAFSANGELLFVAHGAQVQIWDITEVVARMRWQLKENESVRRLVPLNSDKIIVSTSLYTNQWQLPLDAQSQQPKRLHRFRDNRAEPLFLPDQNLVVSVDANSNIAVRDADAFDEIKFLIRIDALVNYQYDPHRQLLYCSTLSGKTHGFDLTDGQEVVIPIQTFFDDSKIQLSQDGLWLLSSATKGSLVLRELFQPSVDLKNLNERISYQTGRTVLDGRVQFVPPERQLEQFEKYHQSWNESPVVLDRWEKAKSQNRISKPAADR
ncbi:MAG: protein kinase [Planctomycetota bacterium]